MHVYNIDDGCNTLYSKIFNIYGSHLIRMCRIFLTTEYMLRIFLTNDYIKHACTFSLGMPDYMPCWQNQTYVKVIYGKPGNNKTILSRKYHTSSQAY